MQFVFFYLGKWGHRVYGLQDLPISKTILYHTRETTTYIPAY